MRLDGSLGLKGWWAHRVGNSCGFLSLLAWGEQWLPQDLSFPPACRGPS